MFALSSLVLYLAAVIFFTRSIQATPISSPNPFVSSSVPHSIQPNLPESTAATIKLLPQSISTSSSSSSSPSSSPTINTSAKVYTISLPAGPAPTARVLSYSPNSVNSTGNNGKDIPSIRVLGTGHSDKLSVASSPSSAFTKQRLTSVLADDDATLVDLCQGIGATPPCVRMQCGINSCCNFPQDAQNLVSPAISFGPTDNFSCGLFRNPNCNNGVVSADTAAFGFTSMVDLSLGWEPKSYRCELLFKLDTQSLL